MDKKPKKYDKLGFLSNQPDNKLSFLDDKITLQHNMYDLVGKGLFSAYKGKFDPQKLLDKARFNMNIDLEKGYEVDLDYGKGDYKFTLSKDLY